MSQKVKVKIDPVVVSVVRNRLQHITQEMGQTMLRTARSPIFSEARDFVTAVFDRRGNKVAQTSFIPVLVDSTPWAMRAMEKAFSGSVKDGDIYVLNDPFQGNNHGPDITVVKPVFFEGEHMFWTLSKGHHIDIGGKGVVGYNPLAETVFDEGMHFGPSRLYDGGVLNEAFRSVFFNNLFMPDVVDADLQSQIGAVRVGDTLLRGLLAKHGTAGLESVIDEILSSSERRMREALRGIPDGVYEGEAWSDNAGASREPVRFHAKVTVAGDEIDIDMSGSQDQVIGYINSPICNTASAVSIALFLCLDPDIPHNDSGSGVPINVHARKGSVVNPTRPSAVVLSTTSGTEAIISATLEALAQAMPERVPADWSRMCIPNTQGFNPNTGRMFGEMHSIVRGGSGATPTADGYDSLGSAVCLGGFRATCPELFEMTAPVILHEYSYLPDSAGAGQYRGGFGVKAEWEYLENGMRSVLWGAGNTEKTRPLGRHGGQPGLANHHQILNDGVLQDLEPNTFVDISKGSRYVIKTGGGGGWGDPAQREPSSVLSDVCAGLVSADVALNTYLVVIDDEQKVDESATKALREKR